MADPSWEENHFQDVAVLLRGKDNDRDVRWYFPTKSSSSDSLSGCKCKEYYHHTKESMLVSGKSSSK
eukprot:scaffold1789_cov200-Skeletonema_marinoi.AAC.6